MSESLQDMLKSIPVSAPQVHATHPLKHSVNHEKLLKYVKERMEFGNIQRSKLTSRYESIDKDVAAYMVLSDDDKKLRTDQLNGKGPKGVSMHVPFVLLQLDDALTYFLNVFAPETGMYQAIGRKDQQAVLNSLATLMNDHAQTRGYFRQILKFCFDCMKYNLGGIRTQWETRNGNVVKNSEARRPVASREVIWQGNDIQTIDMYNVIWDPSVHPVDISEHGEFIAEIEVLTAFRLRKLAMDGEYFNVKNITEKSLVESTELSYYKAPPQLWDGATGDSDDATDFVSILSQGTQAETLGSGIELWHMTIQLMPQDFGLVAPMPGVSQRLETWRITVANGMTIIAADHLPNAHGRLPYNFATPMEDNLGFAQKSIAEILAPFQSLGSFLVNTHMAAIRKNIWDLTIFDPSVVDLSQMKEGDVAGRIPVLPSGYGKDINKAIWQNSNLLDTKETMTQLTKVIDLMQLLWPTTASADQIANIDRAVEEQVTTTVTNSNRRLQKVAKLLDVQALSGSRTIMISNIQEYQPEVTILGEDGEELKIDPSTLRGQDFSNSIGQGLKSMDKSAVTRYLQRLITTILQSPEAAQEFDLPGLINALSDFMDMRIDLNQYRKAAVPPQGPGTPETPGTEAAPVLPAPAQG